MSETDISRAIVSALIRHPAVGWLARNNNGSYVKDGRRVAYGLGKGSPDRIGQLKDGRLLAVEVKTPTGRPTKEQLDWVGKIKLNGGVAFFAPSAEEALRKLEEQL